MDMNEKQQMENCLKFGASFVQVAPDSKVGIAIETIGKQPKKVTEGLNNVQFRQAAI